MPSVYITSDSQWIFLHQEAWCERRVNYLYIYAYLDILTLKGT